MQLKHRFFHSAVGMIAISCFFFGKPLFADGLNLQLNLAEPDADFFEPGDIVPATLILTDDEGNNLRVDEFDENGLTLLELWVSGPRQKYETVGPYRRNWILSPQSGFDQNSGFDPETGRIDIELPNNMGDDGTYTVLFYCKRIIGDHVYNRFASADFQVGQIRRTFTFSNRYLTCDRCHANPTCGHSGNNTVTQCVVCHTKDYVLAFNNFIHLRRNHPENQRSECIQCHRAAGGVGDYALNACYSCHNNRNDHRNRTDDMCLGCHGNDAYRQHQLDTPTTPRSFDLLEPEDDTVLDTSSVILSWEASRDNDWDDMLDYQVELALDRQFDNVRIFDLQRPTSFDLQGLEDNTDYWWRVKAVDMNSDGRYSSQSWQLFTTFADPQPSFNLLTPADEDTLGKDCNFEIEAAWNALTGINPDDQVSYEAVFGFHAPNMLGFDLTFIDLVDTTLHFDWADSVDMDTWDRYFTVVWTVTAFSEGDTIDCESPFTFTIVPNPDSAPNDMKALPTEFFVSEVYPNPFNSKFNVDFNLPYHGYLAVTVHDLSGRKVMRLAEGDFNAGRHTLTFDGTGYTSGIYLLKCDFNRGSQGVLKVLLLN